MPGSILHDSHTPLHDDSQHTPSVQNEDAQSLPFAQAVPFAFVPTPPSPVGVELTSKSPRIDVQPTKPAAAMPKTAAAKNDASVVVRFIR